MPYFAERDWYDYPNDQNKDEALAELRRRANDNLVKVRAAAPCRPK